MSKRIPKTHDGHSAMARLRRRAQGERYGYPCDDPRDEEIARAERERIRRAARGTEARPAS